MLNTTPTEKANNLVDQTADQALHATQRGVQAVRDGSHQLLDRALRVSEGTASYVRGEPVKSLLIAAATGAALMALVGMMVRSHGRN
jgi:ElaB/YqjD/DUF883 family membrane-anchored ribosome-binding protein